MTTQYYSGPEYGGRSVSFVIALILGALSMVLFMHHARQGVAGRIADRITGREAGTDRSAAVVAQRMRQMGQIETASFAQDALVEGGHPLTVDTATTGVDRLLLLVHEDLIAGVVLTQFSPDQIRIDDGGRGIHLILPRAQILQTKVDTHQVRLLDRSSGQFVAMTQDLGPETQARAEEQMQRAALADGTLEAASRNARVMVLTSLSAQGFEQIDVR